MAELDLGRAVLVGHDLGGGVVQNRAVSNAQRCAALLLTNAIGYDSWPIPSVKMLRGMVPLVRRLPNAVVRSTIFGMLVARGHYNAAMARESMWLHRERYAGSGGRHFSPEDHAQATAAGIRSLLAGLDPITAGRAAPR